MLIISVFVLTKTPKNQFFPQKTVRGQNKYRKGWHYEASRSLHDRFTIIISVFVLTKT
jgi:hypothetical protein